MGKVKQYKRGISAFISSEKGQRFFNFAYSIGAAIVIWGALFKILHLPGGNTLLSIGMGTEVLMFVLTAFDRPPKEYNWEEVFPQLTKKTKQEIEEAKEEEVRPEDVLAEANAEDGSPAVNVVSGGTFVTGPIIGGGAYSAGAAYPDSAPAEGIPAMGAEGIPAAGGPIHTGAMATGVTAMPVATDFAGATQLYIDQINSIAQELQKLQDTTEALNSVSETLMKSYDAISEHSEEIKDSSTGYADQIQTLNRNIAGLNTIYEIQLKSVSSQIDAIDRVNKGIKDIRDMFEKSAEQSTRYCEETEKMARYMQQLNQVYEKMITAMTINMQRPLGGVMPNQD